MTNEREAVRQEVNTYRYNSKNLNVLKNTWWYEQCLPQLWVRIEPVIKVSIKESYTDYRQW